MAKYKKFRDEIDPNAPIWSKRINQCLIDNNITQSELAKESRLSSGTITTWINGNKKGIVTEPKASGLIRVANALDVSIDYLLGNVNIKSKDLDIRAICKKTGLAEKSVIYLLGPDRDNINKLIDIMVENENTENRFLGSISDIIDISEDIRSVKFPIYKGKDLIINKEGPQPFGFVINRGATYYEKYKKLELDIFNLQVNFINLLKKMTKFYDIKIKEK